MNGFLVAAPSSGAGKTLVTLGLLRALFRAGVPLAPAKAGPDYIDPRFHEKACGKACVNLDPWAMGTGRLHALTRSREGMLVVEAMMGLFDGAADGTGTPADLAATLNLPVVLVVDCARMSHSVAALAHGFATWRADVRLAGLILNRVASDRHERMLRGALADVSVLGVLRRDPALTLPERHLGLVQAVEHAELDTVVERAADAVDAGVDLDALCALTCSPSAGGGKRMAPLAQRIAIADDVAFGFRYPHMLDDWRAQGAELSFFSPLANAAPEPDAAVFLPGGYPELHAGRIAAASGFLDGLRRAPRVYGECGGYMVMGEGLVDAGGERHAMAGLLPLETSFAKRRLHLGYRRLRPLGEGPLGSEPLRAHEFHYASIVREGKAERLFAVTDAEGTQLPPAGLRVGGACGSFMHAIDRDAA